jgi:hypothetical protein
MKTTLPKPILIALLLLLLSATAYLQTPSCGTIVNTVQHDFELTIVDSLTKVKELNRTLHLAIYITLDENGNTNIDTTRIPQSIDFLNSALDKIKVKFEVDTIIKVANYHLDLITQGTTEKELVTRNHTLNTINLYLVGQLANTANQSTCGFTYYPSANNNNILIVKSCLSGIFLTEQIGHLFNLYHTHETIFGAESVNHSNCGIAGDLCCDTYADPNLAGKVSAGCIPSNLNGYTPSVKNYMSFSYPDCKCFFSDEQYLRMLNAIVLFKSYLW